ncbi:hypothetical protein [Mediterranea sp. An20]|nr:hypothetical protein [Mediterranea sp. An20]
MNSKKEVACQQSADRPVCFPKHLPSHIYRLPFHARNRQKKKEEIAPSV